MTVTKRKKGNMKVDERTEEIKEINKRTRGKNSP